MGGLGEGKRRKGRNWKVFGDYKVEEKRILLQTVQHSIVQHYEIICVRVQDNKITCH